MAYIESNRPISAILVDLVNQFTALVRKAAEFLQNLRREIRDNPMPLVLIVIGIAWLIVTSNRTSRAAIAAATDTAAKKAEDIGVATSAAVSRTSEWGQQMVARLSDRASDVANTVGNTAGELADRTRDATGGLADKARSAATGAVSTFDRANQSLSGASADDAAPMCSDRPANSIAYRENTCADERR